MKKYQRAFRRSVFVCQCLSSIGCADLTVQQAERMADPLLDQKIGEHRRYLATHDNDRRKRNYDLMVEVMLKRHPGWTPELGFPLVGNTSAQVSPQAHSQAISELEKKSNIPSECPSELVLKLISIGLSSEQIRRACS